MGSILTRCEGFAVHTQLARVGTVEAVTIRPGGERPSSLTVRAGLVGSWLLEVPLDQIAEVMPRERRIILRPGGLVERVGRPDEPSSSRA